jgi:hypothetical protein
MATARGVPLIGIHLNTAVILSAAKDLRPRLTTDDRRGVLNAAVILSAAKDDRWHTFAGALAAAPGKNTRAIPNSGMALVLPTMDGNEGRWSTFAFQLRNDLIRLSTLFT